MKRRLSLIALLLKFMVLYLVGPTEIPAANTSKEVGRGAWGVLSGSNAYHASSDVTLFSSSLPVLPHAICTDKIFCFKFIVLNLEEDPLPVCACMQ